MWLRFVHLWRSESFSSRSLRLENHVGTRTATDACIVFSYNDEVVALTAHLFWLGLRICMSVRAYFNDMYGENCFFLLLGYVTKVYMSKRGTPMFVSPISNLQEFGYLYLMSRV